MRIKKKRIKVTSAYGNFQKRMNLFGHGMIKMENQVGILKIPQLQKKNLGFSMIYMVALSI